ncbi:hypothetical protein L596_005290 [Steinernema carpocapsae]|uniref:Uncharacterized protein n=1 Tax=Steinernema carpocapsae TaxID=34508 RepID=A0A4U8UYH5_STECR|nr:hypothetical protein L596_005290 [Steinernema carpocapsae]
MCDSRDCTMTKLNHRTIRLAQMPQINQLNFERFSSSLRSWTLIFSKHANILGATQLNQHKVLKHSRASIRLAEVLQDIAVLRMRGHIRSVCFIVLSTFSSLRGSADDTLPAPETVVITSFSLFSPIMIPEPIYCILVPTSGN